MIIKLSKAVEFEGNTISELDLNLESLTGQDMIDAQKEASNGDATPVQEFSKEHLAILVAKACGKPTDLIPHLGIKDFSRVTVEVQNFLLGEE